jgi:thiol:disulfide interchange protein
MARNSAAKTFGLLVMAFIVVALIVVALIVVALMIPPRFQRSLKNP